MRWIATIVHGLLNFCVVVDEVSIVLTLLLLLECCLLNLWKSIQLQYPNKTSTNTPSATTVSNVIVSGNGVPISKYYHPYICTSINTVFLSIYIVYTCNLQKNATYNIHKRNGIRKVGV